MEDFVRAKFFNPHALAVSTNVFGIKGNMPKVLMVFPTACSYCIH